MPKKANSTAKSSEDSIRGVGWPHGTLLVYNGEEVMDKDVKRDAMAQMRRIESETKEWMKANRPQLKNVTVERVKEAGRWDEYKKWRKIAKLDRGCAR